MTEKVFSLNKKALWRAADNVADVSCCLERVSVSLHRLYESLDYELPPKTEEDTDREFTKSICFSRRAGAYLEQFYTFLEALDLHLTKLDNVVEAMFKESEGSK